MGGGGGGEGRDDKKTRMCELLLHFFATKYEIENTVTSENVKNSMS